jgi:hypothetical protein
VPETRFERALFVLGLAVIAALGVLVVHLWHTSHGAFATATPTAAATAPRTAPATTRVAERTTTRTAASSRPSARPTPPRVSLVLSAISDSWLEIRSASATGAILYSGLLTAGSRKVFRGQSLWARFGGAGSLSARFDGQLLRLPSGTYDARFDRHGFRQVGG